MFRLTTLGATDLRDRRGHPIRDVLAQPKRVALLVYLALESKRGPVPRDRLLASFWPESDEAHARNALSQSLHHLRHELGPDLLDSRGASAVQIQGELLWCDALVFMDALERGDGELALDLYRGEFCPTLFVSGSPDIERWLDEQRRRLRQQALAAARARAELLASHGDIEEGARAARRALALRPDDEADVRALLAVLDRAGDGTGALHAYQEYARQLAAEIEAEPEPLTRQLVDAIRKRRESAGVAGDLPGLPASPPAPGATPERPVPAAPRSRNARRVAVMAAAATAVVVLAAATWRIMAVNRSMPPADPGLMVVAPLHVASPDSTLRYLGEGLADLVAAKLVLPGRLRAMDLRPVLAAWRRAGAVEAPLGEMDALAEARHLGAGRLVIGSVVGPAARLLITATVLGTDGRSRQEISATGPVDSLASLADRIAGGVLTAISGEPLPRGDLLRGVGLEALRPYLLARSAFRSGRYEEARGLFDEALATDSGFVLAALGRIQAEDFLPGGTTSAPRQLAWRHRNEFGAADRVLLSALGADYPRRASESEILGDWERFSRLAPERPEAWYGLGDALFHYGNYLGRDSGFTRAEAAMARAVAMDSGFAAPLAHLVQIAAAREDRRAVRKLAARYFARDTTSDVALFLRWRVALALGDRASALGIEARPDTLPLGTLELIAEWATIEGLSGPTALRMAEELYRRVGDAAGEADYAERLLLSVAVAAGRFNRANEMAAAQLRRYGKNPDAFWWRVASGWLLDGPRQALDSVLRYTDAHWTAQERAEAASVRFLWFLRTQPRDSALAVAYRAYHSIEQEQASDWSSPLVAAAWFHRPDLAIRFARSDSLRNLETPPNATHVWIDAWARFLSGDTARAAAESTRRPWATGGDQMIAPLYRIEGFTHELAGDTAGAVRAYRRYLNLRSDPDPDARPWADSVRSSLARLESRSRSR